MSAPAPDRGADGRGLFVVFEGGDGGGKTTQVRELAHWLTERGLDHLVTREPGGTWLGERMRALVLDPDSGPIAPRAETLLYLADKAQHVDEVVLPAMARGQVVVCDRYVDSLLAYQGAGRTLEPHALERVARWATDDLRPDLTVVLDVDPDDGVHRKPELDRLERAGADFHRRVRDRFLELAAADPEHYLVLPARRPVAWITRQVRTRVAELLGLAAEELSEPSGRVVTVDEDADGREGR